MNNTINIEGMVGTKSFEEFKNRMFAEEAKKDNKTAQAIQERLVQCCIDYINETEKKEIGRVSFTADCLQESAKVGSWQPCTDSTCEIEYNNGDAEFSA